MEKTSIKKSSLSISENGLEKKKSSGRLEVLKTYKIYIGGQFPRTESGRYYIPTNEDFMLNAGLWYWSKNAVVPYIGISYEDYQFGLSYDVTTSKLNQATEKPKTWELSIIVRGRNKPSFVIPCPWK